MPFCVSCGGALEENDRFCAACGTPVRGGGAVPARPPAASSSPPRPAALAGLSDNGAAVLCYAFGFISAIIFLVVQPWAQNERVRFHAFQSIFFNVAWFIFSILAFVVGSIVAVESPMAGSGIMIVLYLAVWGGGVALWIVLMVKAYAGRRVILPIIGSLSKKAAAINPGGKR